MTAARTSTRSARANAASKAADVANNAIAHAKEKAKIGIYSRNGDKVQVALFVTVSDSERAPMFGGLIAGGRVSAFLRHPVDARKSPFFSFVNEKGVQVGTANVVVRKNGSPVLKALLGLKDAPKTQVWLGVSKNVSDDSLGIMGANMAKLHVNNKEAATA